MPSLKDLKNRIGSVKSTQKITSAMKMVAAAKLRKAQEQAIASRPYCSSMEKIVSSLASKLIDNAPELLKGKKDIKKQLLVVFSADRGLCGGFNGSISRAVKLEVKKSKDLGIETKLLFVGRKSADTLKKDFQQHIVLDYLAAFEIKYVFSNLLLHPAIWKDYVLELPFCGLEFVIEIEDFF